MAAKSAKPLQNRTTVRFFWEFPCPSPNRPPPSAARDGRALQKGQQTKAAIVDAALALASQIGLEGLSIGALAEVTEMSKSGVFAHFGSREELQISVVREYHARFEEEVFFPAMQRAARPAAPARAVRQLDEAHLDRDRLGLHLHQRRGRVRRPARARCATRWSSSVQHLAGGDAARHRASPRTKATCAPTPTSDQLLFEIHGLILALHYDARFLQSPGSMARANAGFDNILAARYGAPPTPG